VYQFFEVVTFVVESLFVEGGELMSVEGEMRAGRLFVGSLFAGVGSQWVVAVEVGILLVEVAAGILSVEVVGIPLAEVEKVVEIEMV
jgi:hypothetical protein